MVSIFSRIIAGEVPGRLVWDDGVCVVMVDIRPLRRGHCLVIPKEEVDHWIDLDVETAAHLMKVASLVGQVQAKVFDGSRIGLMIAGFEVPHTHIHVAPADSMADFDFSNADASPSESDLDTVAVQLRTGLRDSGGGSSVVGL